MNTSTPNLPAGAIKLDDPAASFIAVTPSDSADLPTTGCRGLFVGTGGNVVVVDPFGNTAVTFKNVPDGSLLPVRAKRVKSSGTTASDIVALY